MNLPNKLTLLRILLVPVFMVCASQGFHAGWLLAAGIVFAVASFTDFLDGYLARKNHMVTDFGKFADPLADKLLTTTAFVYMMMMGACDPVVLVIILAREFAVSGLRMVAAGAQGGKVIAANIWGKVKTVLQMLTIIVFYFELALDVFLGSGMTASMYPSQLVGYVLCWVVAAVTLLSGVKYLWDNRSFIDTAK
ncbi:MAG: CDP-diacylglycerol--glycerol-3-phosphate 3-phosphatidyltransferase [Ruthenibacterium sp.]